PATTCSLPGRILWMPPGQLSIPSSRLTLHRSHTGGVAGDRRKQKPSSQSMAVGTIPPWILLRRSSQRMSSKELLLHPPPPPKIVIERLLLGEGLRAASRVIAEGATEPED